MHPSATRSIRISSMEGDPTNIARDVLIQYGDLIRHRTEYVRKKSPEATVDMRTGWLLWQESLHEFLYYEEPMTPPEPNKFYAEWVESGGGIRKKSQNLWVYEAESGRKRYSITTAAGAKIQPYFDVPPPNDPNLYHFVVQGEPVGYNQIRVWLTSTTALCLRQIIGDFDGEKVSEAILNLEKASRVSEPNDLMDFHPAVALTISREAYQKLKSLYEGVSDEHLFQQFINQLNDA